MTYCITYIHRQSLAVVTRNCVISQPLLTLIESSFMHSVERERERERERDLCESSNPLRTLAVEGPLNATLYSLGTRCSVLGLYGNLVQAHGITLG
jgi:hypothetical protein